MKRYLVAVVKRDVLDKHAHNKDRSVFTCVGWFGCLKYEYGIKSLFMRCQTYV